MGLIFPKKNKQKQTKNIKANNVQNALKQARDGHHNIVRWWPFGLSPNTVSLIQAAPPKGPLSSNLTQPKDGHGHPMVNSKVTLHLTK